MHGIGNLALVSVCCMCCKISVVLYSAVTNYIGATSITMFVPTASSPPMQLCATVQFWPPTRPVNGKQQIDTEYGDMLQHCKILYVHWQHTHASMCMVVCDALFRCGNLHTYDLLAAVGCGAQQFGRFSLLGSGDSRAAAIVSIVPPAITALRTEH